MLCFFDFLSYPDLLIGGVIAGCKVIRNMTRMLLPFLSPSCTQK